MGPKGSKLIAATFFSAVLVHPYQIRPFGCAPVRCHLDVVFDITGKNLHHWERRLSSPIRFGAVRICVPVRTKERNRIHNGWIYDYPMGNDYILTISYTFSDCCSLHNSYICYCYVFLLFVFVLLLFLRLPPNSC